MILAGTLSNNINNRKNKLFLGNVFPINNALTVIVGDCLPIILLFSTLHLTILPYLCSNLAFSVYFRGTVGTATNNSEEESSVSSPGGERKDQSRMRIVIQTSERRGDYMRRTILSVRRELSLARDGYQVYLCSGDNKDFTEIPEMPELTLVQPCKQNRKDCSVH